ncbi:MAG: hypothetical protein A4E38_01679 [Methanoregulaceae archaeon PtaB.Bin108]|nr:MAG: hypothetical protein A4E38_01679 [Methanoregulaceae archaeon PtaB.Bin108]
MHQPRPDQAHGDGRGLLHDFPELAGQGEFSFPGHERALNEKDIASGRCPCKACRYAGHSLLSRLFLPDNLFSEYRRKHFWPDDEWQVDTARYNLLGDVTGNPCKLFLQPPDAGLAGVPLDNCPEGIVIEDKGARIQPMLLECCRKEMIPGNRELFLISVSRDLDQFHPVEEGSRDGGERVGSRNEQHFREVVGDLQVVIRERGILFGIQDFKESARRIAHM